MYLQLTRKAELALCVLRALDTGQRRTAAVLAAEVGTSAAYLTQVMAPLVAAGWVGSGVGPRGGYEPSGDLHRISVLDVIEQIEGPTGMRTALRPLEDGENDVHVAWRLAREALRDHLANTPVVPSPRADDGGDSPTFPASTGQQGPQ